MAQILLVLTLFSLASCSTLPHPVPVDPVLDGEWIYLGGEPTSDPLLSWGDWPDGRLDIDAKAGRWDTTPGRGKGPRTVLPSTARVVKVDGNVLTLIPETGGSPFQVYWRQRDGRLEFWWGDQPDWLKPFVIYRRP